MAGLPVDLVVFDIMGTLVKDVGAMENAHAYSAESFQ